MPGVDALRIHSRPSLPLTIDHPLRDEAMDTNGRGTRARTCNHIHTACTVVTSPHWWITSYLCVALTIRCFGMRQTISLYAVCVTVERALSMVRGLGGAKNV